MREYFYSCNDDFPLYFRYFKKESNMPLARDLLHPSIDEERRKHKKKRLVQSPNSYFMDVKCPGCYKITTGKTNNFLFCFLMTSFLFSFQSCTNGSFMRWL